MSATEELRRLLDERGVAWTAPNSCLRDEMTSWAAGGFDYEAFEVPEPDGTFLLTAAHQDDLTPEQAIAATLGSDREAELQKALNKAAGNWAKADAELRKALDFMRIWISEDAHLGESAISCELEKAEGLRNLDAIESAIAATLGVGECGEAMNRFGLQIKELREKADELRNVHVDDENVGLLFAAIGAMREAADTIEKLEPHSNQLEPSRYSELFGTPERAARTLLESTSECRCCVIRDECGFVLDWCVMYDHDKLLEWLKGEGE